MSDDLIGSLQYTTAWAVEIDGVVEVDTGKRDMDRLVTVFVTPRGEIR